MVTVAGANNSVAWKLLATGSALGGAVVTKKVVGIAWKAATGSEPPANPENPDTTWSQAMVWAMLTGAVAGATKLLITRKAAAQWRSSTGTLPPGVASA